MCWSKYEREQWERERREREKEREEKPLRRVFSAEPEPSESERELATEEPERELVHS